MKKVHVIGLGSPFGDDCIGWLAVERLRHAPWPRRFSLGLTLHVLDRPGVGLLHAMKGARAVVLVDAIRSGAPPGTLHRLTGQDLVPTEVPVSTHDLGVAAAIELAAALGELPEYLVLLGIEIDDPTRSGPLLSPVAACRLPALVAAVRAELATLLSIVRSQGRPG